MAACEPRTEPWEGIAPATTWIWDAQSPELLLRLREHSGVPAHPASLEKAGTFSRQDPAGRAGPRHSSLEM